MIRASGRSELARDKFSRSMTRRVSPTFNREQARSHLFPGESSVSRSDPS
jgi:hypothetical protein